MLHQHQRHPRTSATSTSAATSAAPAAAAAAAAKDNIFNNASLRTFLSPRFSNAPAHSPPPPHPNDASTDHAPNQQPRKRSLRRRLSTFSISHRDHPTSNLPPPSPQPPLSAASSTASTSATAPKFSLFRKGTSAIKRAVSRRNSSFNFSTAAAPAMANHDQRNALDSPQPSISRHSSVPFTSVTHTSNIAQPLNTNSAHFPTIPPAATSDSAAPQQLVESQPQSQQQPEASAASADELRDEPPLQNPNPLPSPPLPAAVHDVKQARAKLQQSVLKSLQNSTDAIQVPLDSSNDATASMQPPSEQQGAKLPDVATPAPASEFVRRFSGMDSSGSRSARKSLYSSGNHSAHSASHSTSRGEFQDPDSVPSNLSSAQHELDVPSSSTATTSAASNSNQSGSNDALQRRRIPGPALQLPPKQRLTDSSTTSNSNSKPGSGNASAKQTFVLQRRTSSSSIGSSTTANTINNNANLAGDPDAQSADAGNISNSKNAPANTTAGSSFEEKKKLSSSVPPSSSQSKTPITPRLRRSTDLNRANLTNGKKSDDPSAATTGSSSGKTTKREGSIFSHHFDASKFSTSLPKPGLHNRSRRPSTLTRSIRSSSSNGLSMMAGDSATASSSAASDNINNVTRVSRTGFIERSVAGGMISAARNARSRNRTNLSSASPSSPNASAAAIAALKKPAHHSLHGGYKNPWASSMKDHTQLYQHYPGESGGGLTGAGTGAGARSTFFHKVAKDKKAPDEEVASLLLLADKPDIPALAQASSKDKNALSSIWLGHCTLLMHIYNGIVLLTDPVWHTRLGPLGPKRLIPPMCAIDALPQTIHFVLLSSACYDHYDKHAIAQLAPRVRRWFVPLGMKPLLAGLGISATAIVQLDWWQEYKDMDVHATGAADTSTDKQNEKEKDKDKPEQQSSDAQTGSNTTSNSSSSNAVKNDNAANKPANKSNATEKEASKADTSKNDDTQASKPGVSAASTSDDKNNSNATSPTKPTASSSASSQPVAKIKLICTPAQHHSVREGTLWCSWTILTPYHRIFYCGGTGYRVVDESPPIPPELDTFDARARFGRPYCPAFREIGTKYGPFDTAFLPIGGSRPRAVMSSFQGDAVDMLFVHRDVQARKSVAIKWGTFQSTSSDEGLLDAIRTLEFALQTGPVSENDFCYLKHGRVNVT